jgi:hypothetical protein
MTNAIRSQGTRLQHGTGANPVVFADIEECTDIQLGGVSVAVVDVTHLLSLGKESVPGLLDPGTITLTCNYTGGAVQKSLYADVLAGQTSPYQLILGGSATPITISFNAYVTKYDGPTAKVDGKLDLSISLKITGVTTTA